MTSPSPARRPPLDLKSAFKLALQAAESGRLREAENFYRAILKAVALPEAARNLGLLLDEQGRRDEAEALYRAFLERVPDDTFVQLLLASMLLRDGRLEEAWPFFEARARRPGKPPKPKLSFPEWQGEEISSLLVWHEEGLGDQIQFARFAREASLSGRRVTLMCPPQLERLFQSLEIEVIATEGRVDIPRHDAWVMLCSLPLRLGVKLPTLVGRAYLPGRAGGQGVGIMTRGNQEQEYLAHRTLPPEAAAALAEVLPGAVSLAPEDSGAKDFQDTADLISRLDLVVTIDTAVAHLAGAMGKPCWILLPHKADWRWMRDRSDSPWYDSVRLFRQPAAGDWASVIAEVGQAYRERCN